MTTLASKNIRSFAYCLLLCLAPVFTFCQQYPFQNSSLDFETRVEDLLKRLTVEEKVTLMQDVSKPISRLGIQEYNWWNEALHGVARAGLATVFPQPIGMAASFDQDAVLKVFSAVSDEARAKYNVYSAKNSYGRYEGLTMWTPTINIFRDPRWGRGIETYGEDPYLTGMLGLAAVKGLQGKSQNGYDKLHACAKHFAVHSGPEWNRHSFNAANIKPRDLYETYLPAFEKLVKEGNVQEVMCAYNRFEGDPCCGSDQLLINILREKWGFKGVVVADCGAIADFYKENTHMTHADAATASAAAVLSGTDLDCGTSYKALVEAVNKGHIKEEALDVSVRRLLLARFRLGEMDPPSMSPWASISAETIASQAHHEIALEMARKSMTLLQNKNNILPLQRTGMKIAVMGPNANDSVMQWGNYTGTPPNTITILEGIRNALGDNYPLIYEQGSGLVENMILQSALNQCFSDQEQGFTAKYWNTKNKSGTVAATQQLTNAFTFCTSGATVFAPNVNLTGFSSQYNSTFKPNKSGTVVFDFYVNGIVSLLVNGKEVKNIKTGHGSRKFTHSMNVEKGKSYDLQIDFAHNMGDAQLNFDIGFKEAIDIQKSLAKVADANVIIFVGGISPQLEGEEMGVNLPGFRGGDRTDIELPATQRNFIAALKKAGKKVIMVNCSGSPIGLTEEVKNCEAILQAWYPGQAGGQAVAEVLFGDYNPSGRLPVTFYKDTTQLPDFENYDMKGRTYRYLTTTPLFPFGFGLSYTTFKYGNAVLSKTGMKAQDSVILTIPVTNTGKRNGDEIVQLYVHSENDKDGPVKALRGVQRVSVAAGQTVQVTFKLTARELEYWDEFQQEMTTNKGHYNIFVGGSSDNKDLKKIKMRIL
jgi:beta-glucosidase